MRATVTQSACSDEGPPSRFHAPPVLRRLVSLAAKRLDIERTLKEQRQVRDEEHQEDTDDTPVDPLEHRSQVVATRLTNEGARGRVLANSEFAPERAEVNH